MEKFARHNFIILAFFFCVLLSMSVNSNAGKIIGKDLARSAMSRTKYPIIYDPTYFSIKYPLGDVPADKGVCTDVIIRSYRPLGIDLQKLVHEDMKNNFQKYPKIWGLKTPDTNIDHRRVPNLQVFFKRQGAELPITKNPNDYKPGDIVTWNIGGKNFIPHIGIISNQKTAGQYKVIHNIGRGVKAEKTLFEFPITGHYRYMG